MDGIPWTISPTMCLVPSGNRSTMSPTSPRGRRPKPYSQAERLARLIRALSSRALTMKEISDEFQITRRQAYRDLARIEEQGHPLVHSEGTGERSWQLPLGYKGLPPITLSPYELMSLQLARAELAYLDGTPFTEDLDNTLAKLKASLPAKTLNHYERILQVFAALPKPMHEYGKESAVLRDLRKALLLQLTVDLDYQKPRSARAQDYRVDPYALVLYQRALYVIGYSHGAKEERIFAVARMRQVSLTDERFTLPDNYSPSRRFGHLFGLVEDEPYDVVLHVHPDLAHLFQEAKWHPTQRVSPLKNGHLEVRFTAGGLEEIAWWVQSYGDGVVVVAPRELIELVKTNLSNALKQYS